MGVWSASTKPETRAVQSVVLVSRCCMPLTKPNPLSLSENSPMNPAGPAE